MTWKNIIHLIRRLEMYVSYFSSLSIISILYGSMHEKFPISSNIPRSYVSNFLLALDGQDEEMQHAQQIWEIHTHEGKGSHGERDTDGNKLVQWYLKKYDGRGLIAVNCIEIRSW
jgi:hypothetical protein